jgi:hypothetical protein
MSAEVQRTIRPASLPDDGDLAAEWSRRHDGQPFNPELLPAIGVVCEDDKGPCGMVWAYLSCNIGVAFIEFLVMRPGLQLSESVATGKALMAGIESAVIPLGYGLLVAYSLPACARFLRSMGWECGDTRTKIPMFKWHSQL